MTHPLFFATLVFVGVASTVYFLWSSLEAVFRGADAAVLPAAIADSRRTLENRKNTVLSNLRDLQFDHAARKLSDEDFKPLEKKLRAEARRVLRLLDEDVKPFRALAEARLVAHLEGADDVDDSDDSDNSEHADDGDDSDDSGDSELASRVTCESCGMDNEADAVFCKKCGEELDPSQGEEPSEDEEQESSELNEENSAAEEADPS